MKKIIALFLSGILVLFGCCACATDNTVADTPQMTITETTTPPANEKPSIGVPFIFDELEITIGESVEFTTVDNQFSDLDGKDICKIPITIKNISDETHGLNMFYISYYDATAQLDSAWVYFEDSAENIGDLRSGASKSGYIYFPYTTAGNYMISFSMLIGDPIEIEFEINK